LGVGVEVLGVVVGVLMTKRPLMRNGSTTVVNGVD
jgi:hypothetical protein